MSKLHLQLTCPFLLSALAVVAFGQQTPRQPSPGNPAELQEDQSGRAARPGRKDYRLGPGDILLIEVAGEPDLKRKVKVIETGTIRLPYIDRDLKVAGLTEPEVMELLRQEFTSILKEPQVTVFIEEYHARTASIAGAVNLPKQIPLTREIRVYDLISLAGGLTDKAGNIVQLIHSQPEDSYEIIDIRDLVRTPALNRVIRDGDFLNVPEAGVFYVSGNVNKPGAFPLKDTVRLSQAIAIAGGLAQDSKKRQIHLVRSSGLEQGSGTAEQIVDLSEIEKDPTKDVILKPYDVVLVPEATRSKQARSLMQAFVGGIAGTLGWGLIR
jgi:polysaccharide export outer membrane protein